jgi:cardiolipin synthase
MNLPNFITLIRIMLVPVMLFFLIEGKDLLGLLIFVVAALSDGLDGFIARAFKQKTRLGAFLDPLADKILLTTAFVVLAVKGFAPNWLAIMVASRDLLIMTGIGILAWDNDFPSIKPTLDGKATTFFQLVTVAFLLAHDYTGDYQWLYLPLITCTGLLTAISGTRYIIIGFRLLEENSNGEKR